MNESLARTRTYPELSYSSLITQSGYVTTVPHAQVCTGACTACTGDFVGFFASVWTSKIEVF